MTLEAPRQRASLSPPRLYRPWHGTSSCAVVWQLHLLGQVKQARPPQRYWQSSTWLQNDWLPLSRVMQQTEWRCGRWSRTCSLIVSSIFRMATSKEPSSQRWPGMASSVSLSSLSKFLVRGCRPFSNLSLVRPVINSFPSRPTDGHWLIRRPQPPRYYLQSKDIISQP